jgi:hypothetical protein
MPNKPQKQNAPNMKINMPNKALSNKILCGAITLMVYLVPPQAYSSINDWPSIKKIYERGLAIGIGRSKASARVAALKLIPKGSTRYGGPVYIKHENNTYTCYLKWKWSLEDVLLSAK